MNVLDIILLLCLIPAVVQGFTKGFIAQLFALAALVAGAWTAYHFSWTATHWLLRHIEVSAAVLHAVLFAVLFVTAFYLFNYLGEALRKIVKLVLTGWGDRLLGVVFALLKTGLVIGLLIILFHALNTRFHLVPAGILDESVLYGSLKDITYAVFPYFKEMLSF